jgi:lipopolysaccharide/colanic/teichoic acid biosynthesis glycosyltransferase
MILATWLRQLPSRLRVWSRPQHGNGVFLDEQQFRYEVARERMRTDRNRSPLAILIIELPANRSTAKDFAFLGRLLAERLRITDTVGLISARSLGVLLPDTAKSGAWKVASDVCSVYPPGHDRPDCEVLMYPEDGERDFEDTENGGRSSETEPVRTELKALFVNDTPATKRAIDILGAAIGLTVASPLLLAISVAVKATSRGPAIYSQEREGLGGKRFLICKFRTMRPDADRHQATLRPYSEQDGPAFKMSHDPRTTRIGRLLRRTSLDELPQLWNVLIGDMSLVGPRPLPTGESLQCAQWQRRRLTVVPGMTCIWQIWGRNTVPFDEWMRMDLQYVRRRSLGFDLRLIMKTAPAIVLKQGPR